MKQNPLATPITLRLAWSFAKKGIGWHSIEHPAYDEVLVREIVDWKRLPTAIQGVEYGAVLQVSFWKSGNQVRWVDFASLASGSGGEPLLQLVQGGDASSTTSEH